jgi:hypothetical protein
MGDENPNAGGQVPPTGQVPGAHGSTSPTPPAAPATPPAEPQLTHEQALDALEKTRKSEAAMRVRMARLDELEAKEKAAQQAAMSNEEKFQTLQQEHAALLAERQSERTRSALERAAQQMGCIDPEFAAQGIDLTDVTFDKNDRPTNADALMKAFLAAKPYLVGGQQQQNMVPMPTGGAPMNPGRTSGAAGGQQGNLTMEAIAKMSQTEYAARHAEISKFFARTTEENRRGGGNR